MIATFHFAGIQSKPTFPQFIDFCASKINGMSVNLAERIGTDFFNFGILLLIAVVSVLQGSNIKAMQHKLFYSVVRGEGGINQCRRPH
jgi:hypothetical protein